jgi:hypothetical protein
MKEDVLTQSPLLPKLIKIAEQKIRNASFILEHKPMEEALIILKEAIFEDGDAYNNTRYADANDEIIRLFRPFIFLSPLEQVATLIHEFVHAYQQIAHLGGNHDKHFLGIYRNIIKISYPHLTVGTYHHHNAGGLRYLLHSNNSIATFAVLCPMCKKIPILTREYMVCDKCGHIFD